jgi:hypothetical protein
MPEMKTYFGLGMDFVNVTQFINKIGKLAGGVLVYKHRNTGFTLDNYAGGIGFNNHLLNDIQSTQRAPSFYEEYSLFF